MHGSSFTDRVQTLGTGIAFAGLLASPLLVIPLSEQPIVHTKYLILVVLALVTIGLFIARSWKHRVFSFAVSPFTVPLLLFGLGVLISTFFTVDYPVENLLGMGGAYISMVLIVLFGGNLLDKDKVFNWLPISLISLSSILGVTTLLQVLGVGPSHLLSRIFPTAFPHTAQFNLAGSSLIAAQILFISLVGLVSYMITTGKRSLLHQVGAVIIAGALALHVWTILPGQAAEPTFMPHAAAWSVATDTLKAPRTALIGFGPEGFVNAYNIYKPAWMNSHELWNAQFSQGSNTPFNLVVTTGILGLLSWLFWVVVIVLQTKKIGNQTSVVHYMLLASFIIQLFVPASTVLLTFQAILMLFWIVLEKDRLGDVEIYGLTIRKVKSRTMAHPITNNARIVLYGFSGILILSMVILTYLLGRAYFSYFRSLQAVWAASKNDVVSVYNMQKSAVALNPYLDYTRRRYAMTNLTIAAALAQKADRTEEETQQFSQLVQQAIREGKASTILDPLDTNNWITLSQIYRAMIGVAESADQWAVTSYASAIQTNPKSPVLRVELGGILYAAQNYPEAAQFFQQAIDLKPDYPNAYYNLANTFAEAGEYENAKKTYQQTLQLVPADSEDYVKASQELAEIEKMIAGQATQSAQVNNTTTDNTNPSINASSVVESTSDTVNQPANDELDLGDLTNETSATDSASPTPVAQ